MNLFILDPDPVLAAQENCDKHVCKIILEAAQMVMLAYHEHGMPEAKPDFEIWNAKTHKNNHLSKWVRHNSANYQWTIAHGLALCDEFNLRYGKVHKVQRLLEWCRDNPPPRLPTGTLTTFRQAVAEDCYSSPCPVARDVATNDEIVEAYRAYYVKYKAKFAKWSVRPTPQWFTERTRGVAYDV